MAQSKIGICNTALAMLGAAAIRDFEEDNKRARMCDVFYESVRDYLLSRYDWPFARRYLKLQPLDEDVEDTPENLHGYQLPSDCRTPRDIAPPGSRIKWQIFGTSLYCRIPPESPVYLYYTSKEIDVSTYSDTFIMILALGMASYLAPSITQDKGVAQNLTRRFEIEQREGFESDANVGNSYREPDERPENDTFVNPDGFLGFSPYAEESK